MIICFDGDRTLWDLVYDYKDCYNDLKDWMYNDLNMYVELELIEITVNAHLKYEHKKDNYHRSAFPLCVMRAFNSLYLHSNLKSAPIELLAKAFRIGDRIYDNSPEPKINSFEVIDLIEKAFPDSPLLLLTAGDKVIQNNKIYATGFDGLFFETYITKHKNVSFYNDVCSYYKQIKTKSNAISDGTTNFYETPYVVEEPYECVMIGDSIKHDINPAIEAGWCAIYIPSEREDDDTIIESDRLYRANNLVDAIMTLLLIRNDINDYKNRKMF